MPQVLNHNKAYLALRFSNEIGTTRLTERRHFGSLRIQKPFYPEALSICHVIIIHPSGGIVSGDQLSITTHVGDNAHVVLTTPGASKWYRANQKISKQQITLSATSAASIEWLPQETIFFNGANVQLEHNIMLASDSCYIGGEILCFGRTASGELFRNGNIVQRTKIYRAGKLLWFEQGILHANAASMGNVLILSGNTVCATLIAISNKTFNSTLINQLREKLTILEQDGRTGTTQIKQTLILRYLGNSSQIARHWIMNAWQCIRPKLIGREGIIPRIWHT